MLDEWLASAADWFRSDGVDVADGAELDGGAELGGGTITQV
jgi:hypothetical protein